MAPVRPTRPLRKDGVGAHFKSTKPIILNETARPPGNLAPNIKALSWSPTGSMIAHSTSVNIRVWNPERADVKSSTALQDGPRGAHTSPIEKVAFNPRVEALLASTGLDGMVKLWDVRVPGGGTGISFLGGSGGGAGGASSGGYGAKGAVQGKSGEYKVGEQTLFLTWHPAGTELLVGTTKDVITALDIRMADANLLDANATNNSHNNTSNKYELTPNDRSPVKDKGAFYQMSFTNSGKHLLATTTEGPVKLFKYPTMEPIYNLTAHTGSTYCTQQSPVGTYIAVGGSDGQITLWDTTSWMVPQVLKEQTGAVRDLSFSFDGTYLAAGGGSDTLKENEKGLHIWHVDTGEWVHTIDTVNPVTWIAWHPLRHAIAYAGDPGGLKIVGGLGV